MDIGFQNQETLERLLNHPQKCIREDLPLQWYLKPADIVSEQLDSYKSLVYSKSAIILEKKTK